MTFSEQFKTVNVTSYAGKLYAGATKPIKLDCDDNNTYAVKLAARIDTGLCREFLSAAIGKRLGINIPDFAIVNIDPILYASDHYIDEDIRVDLKKDNRPNFGSLLIAEQITEYESGMSITNEMRKQALWIFIFDMVLQNLDRVDPRKGNGGKPNLLIQGNKFFAIDHEKSLSFTLPILGGPIAVWDIETACKPKNHALFIEIQELSNVDLLIDDVLNEFVKIDDNFLVILFDTMPSSWKCENSKAVVLNHFKEFRANIKLFKKSILEALAYDY